MRFSAEARRPQCPGGHVRDSTRCLAPCRHPASTPAFFWMRACFFTARTSPPGRAVHFREFSASRGGCIRAGSVYLTSRDPPTGDLGWRAASDASMTRVSRRAVPQSDAGRAMLPVRGVDGRGRDAEYSGFCTVQAGVRWDGKGRPHLFMHVTSENMQDNRAPCAGCPDWARHTPTSVASLPRRARIKRRGQLWACGRPCWRRGCSGARACRGRSRALGAGARRPHAVACHARCRRRSGPQYLGHHHALNTYSATK